MLNRDLGAKLVFDRTHRVLSPRPAEAEGPPRDVICCVKRYPLKEAIMAKAREQDQILFNGEEIQLFQDLSPITLRNRRALWPLLNLLCENRIQYRWRFPFGLAATRAGKTTLLRVPDDLHAFCEALQLDPPLLPDWYDEFRLPEDEGGPRPQRFRSPHHASPGRSRGAYTQSGRGARGIKQTLEAHKD